MKTQLLSTLTQKKAWILFFLTLLKLEGSKAGEAFRNCLVNTISDGSMVYNNLLKFVSSGLKAYPGELACCNITTCVNLTKSCANYPFFCNNEGGGPACYPYYSVLRCGGFVGNGTTVGEGWSCQGDESTNSNKINTTKLSDYLKTLTPTGLEKGYAFYDIANCLGNNFCGSLQFCNWDNNGTICYGSTANANGICYSEFDSPWPGTPETNPYKATPTSSIATTSQTISTTASTQIPSLPIHTETNDTNNHLVAKIAIPIGTVTGTSIIASLTYCFCRKKKRERQLLINNSNQLETANVNSQITVNNLKSKEIHPSVVGSSTPVGSPISQTSILTIKEQLINNLKQKLIGHEQLWKDYLDVNNLLVASPQSQLAIREFSQLENELLEFLTIEEIELLKNIPIQTSSHSTNPQTEYFGITKEIRNPQERFDSFITSTENNCRSPQGEYFEVRNLPGF